MTVPVMLVSACAPPVTIIVAITGMARVIIPATAWSEISVEPMTPSSTA